MMLAVGYYIFVKYKNYKIVFMLQMALLRTVIQYQFQLFKGRSLKTNTTTCSDSKPAYILKFFQVFRFW